MVWTVDYNNNELPSRLMKGNVEYTLQITSGAFPYILNYVGWESIFDDRPSIGIQAYGQTEQEAVEMMKEKLRELGVEI